MTEEDTFKQIGEAELTTVLMQQKQETIVIVYLANWLGASHLLENFITDITKEWKDRISFFRIYLDTEYSIPPKILPPSPLPVTVIYQQQKIVDHFSGIFSKNKIRKRLENIYYNL